MFAILFFCMSFVQDSRTEKKTKTLKLNSDDEFEILKKVVKKKQILLNSYFGCSSCFNKKKKIQRKHPLQSQDYQNIKLQKKTG